MLSTQAAYNVFERPTNKRSVPSRRSVMVPLAMLPPRWGQEVAPPPSPYFVSPETSPSTGSNQIWKAPSRPTNKVLTYSYQFGREGSIDRLYLVPPPPVGSLSSSHASSPGSSGTSTQLHTSPVTPPVVPESSLRSSLRTSPPAAQAEKRPIKSVKFRTTNDENLIKSKLRRTIHSQQSQFSLNDDTQRRQLEIEAQRLQQAHDQEGAAERRQNKINNLRRIDAKIAQERCKSNGNFNHLRDDRNYQDSLRSLSRPNKNGFSANSTSGRDDCASGFVSLTSSMQGLNDTRISFESVTAADGGDLSFLKTQINSVSLLSAHELDQISTTLLDMSRSVANCDNMRNHRVLPLLVELLHSRVCVVPRLVRLRAGQALHNIIYRNGVENVKQSRQEIKVLKLLENLRMYTDFLRDAAQQSKITILQKGCQCVRLKQSNENDGSFMICELDDDSFSLLGENLGDNFNRFISIPCHRFINFDEKLSSSWHCLNVEETMAAITRCSFDECHRQPISALGGLPAIAELLQVEESFHRFCTSNSCLEMRRYAIVTLTNLTFGNAEIKSFLCCFDTFIPIMVKQLESSSDTLKKATAHLFRNLAWKADRKSKTILSDSGAVCMLLSAGMKVMEKVDNYKTSQALLKVFLSALWNLSAHCKKNKADICGMDGALAFIVKLLGQNETSIIENGGGILRNISSFIATCPQVDLYRKILRDNGCLRLLVEHLRSSSLTIVANSCGALWNLSSRYTDDQKTLRDLGAAPMLELLTNSKHKSISTCAAAALKNLQSDASFSQPLANSNSNPEPLEIFPPSPAAATDDILEDEGPTNYSLIGFKDDEGRLNENVNAGSDCVKTYYTEGTPFDTPFPLSSAASVTDIRDATMVLSITEEADEISEVQEAHHVANNNIEAESTNIRTESILTAFDAVKEEVQDDLCEKPALYCTEDTPVSDISRAVSSSSLEETPRNLKKTVSFQAPSADSAVRNNTLHQETTPMMFSRASSVESLDSFDQHSMKECYSSCDFSRVTSGWVTPSDLPDSPSQTMPTSPKSRKAPTGGKLLLSQVTPDVVAVGCEPFKADYADKVHAFNNNPKGDVVGSSITEQNVVVKSISTNNTSDRRCTDDCEEKDTDHGQASEVKCEDDEDIYADSDSILAALTLSGMPNPTRSTRIPRSKSSCSSTVSGHINGNSRRSTSSAAGRLRSSKHFDFPADELVKKYYTEDTPLTGSRAVSNSDLSTLSFDNENKSFSSEGEFLQACIQAAIPTPSSCPNSKYSANLKSKLPRLQSSSLEKREAGEGAPSIPSNAGQVSSATFFSRAPSYVQQYSNHQIQTSGNNTFKPSSAQSVNNVRRNLSNSNSIQGDQVRIYDLEDTPLNFSTATSLSDLSLDETREIHRAPVTMTVSNIKSGVELRRHDFDIPCVTSKNDDSLCSVDLEHNMVKHKETTLTTINDVEIADFPRPRAIGRSDTSTASSSIYNDSTIEGGGLKSDVGSEGDSEADDLLANCISSGLPKSRTELKSSKRTHHVRSSKQKECSSVRLIPGVKISELRLSSPKSIADNIAPQVDADAPLKMPLEMSSSTYSTLSSVQPPSMMNSFISLNCDTINGSRSNGSQIMLKKAITNRKNVNDLNTNFESEDDVSCSNIDNINPPSLMDYVDMEASILSIDSISSEVAELPNKHDNPASVELCQTGCEDESDLSKTLIVLKAKDINTDTYTIEGHNEESSTCQDISDMQDDAQINSGYNETLEELPDLPLDNENNLESGCSTIVPPSSTTDDVFDTFFRKPLKPRIAPKPRGIITTCSETRHGSPRATKSTKFRIYEKVLNSTSQAEIVPPPPPQIHKRNISSLSSSSSIATFISNRTTNESVFSSRIIGKKVSSSETCVSSTFLTKIANTDIRKPPKKTISSKISVIWKRVEGKKKTNSQPWRDTAIPEHEKVLLKMHQEQKNIIHGFQQQKKTYLSSPSLVETSASRSRLGFNLSKFSRLKRATKSGTPIATNKIMHTAARETEAPREAIAASQSMAPLTSSESVTINHVRRNNSYVSSMGRIQVNRPSPSQHEASSNSVLVTLV